MVSCEADLPYEDAYKRQVSTAAPTLCKDNKGVVYLFVVLILNGIM